MFALLTHSHQSGAQRASRLIRLDAAWYRARYGVTIACLVALTLASWMKHDAARTLGRAIDVAPPRHETGHAFVAELIDARFSPADVPGQLELYEIHPIRGQQVFSELDRIWGWSLAYRNLTARVSARWPDRAVLRPYLTGPGRQRLDDIRNRGGGRYAVTEGRLYFSAADNSSPLTNGRRYQLFLPNADAAALGAPATILRFCALVVLGLTFLRSLSARGLTQRILLNVLPGLAVSTAMLALAFGAYELYLRHGRHAFAESATEKILDPVAGFLYQPGSEVRWTNHLEFWTVERANSLGFLDAEPVLPKPAGRFRILLVGDSFVEAAQVRQREKLATRLTEELNAIAGPRRTDVVAFGHSGTGQANQLGFYERFGRQIAPDLVVLLVVANDFANNSPLLESIRNGWHPRHPPRPFVERDGANYLRLDPEAGWAAHRLAGSDSSEFHAALLRDPAFAPRLAGWNGPRDPDMDSMFWRDALPPVFEEAIDLTRYALASWKALGQRDGFRVLVVATETLTRGYDLSLGDPALNRRRFEAAASHAGLPFFDLYPYFISQPDPTKAIFRIDRHWTPTGHHWAARAIADFLRTSGLLP